MQPQRTVPSAELLKFEQKKIKWNQEEGINKNRHDRLAFFFIFIV